ncbi:CopD family protein [Ilumatobacter sp.]|uniref:copper resistance CopC/CopD family protein n=1 Tax=Ilumatobacter sp. TaxID=1967498 RepID=UPI003C3D9D37
MFFSAETRIERVRRHLAASIVVLLVTLAGLAVGGGTVSAHTGFSGSTPSAGDVVDAPVELISLVFTGEADEAGDGFLVLDANGQLREPTSVSVTADKKVFTLAFDPALAGGEIGVRWTVSAPDGHLIDGSFSFNVTAPAVETTVAPTTAPPATSTTSAPTSTAPAVAVTTATTQPAPTTQVPAVAVDDGGHDMTAAEMASMDEFLAVDGDRPGESLATLGRVLSFAGIALAIGGVAFAATTLFGERAEIRTLITAVRVVGGVITVGAAMEYVGVTRIAGESLSGYWSWSPGFAAVLRMVAGVAIAAGLALTTVSVRPTRSLSAAANNSGDPGRNKRFRRSTGPVSSIRRPARGGDTPHEPTSGIRVLPRDPATTLDDPGIAVDPAPAVEPETTQPVEIDPGLVTRAVPRDVDIPEEVRREPQGPDERWVPTRASTVAFVGAFLAVISFWFDGHTVSKGWRPLHALANSVHVVAGSVWLGGVVAMTVLIWQRHRRGVPPRALELVVRFSQVASIALGAVVVAGLVMAVAVLNSFGDLTGTEWGQILLLKSGAAVLAMCGGAYNHFRLIPLLNADPDNPALHERMRSVITAEAILLGFVIVVTAWLVAAAS